MNKRIDWVRYALDLAKVAASRSEDPHVKVGATILRQDHSVASLGYNGVPSGINIKWNDRDERRKRVACGLSPCRHCIQAIASYGIKIVCYEEEYDKDEFAFELAKEFGVSLCKYVEGIYE